MKLGEFLAENPDAQKEVDALVSAAVEKATATGKAEGIKEGLAKGEADSKARIEAVLPFVTSDAYSKPIKDLAYKVLNGDVDMAALTGAAAAVDNTTEADASAKAEAEAKKLKETATDSSQSVSEDGIIRSEDDMAAAVASARGED
jgi:hypothetical protein